MRTTYDGVTVPEVDEKRPNRLLACVSILVILVAATALAYPTAAAAEGAATINLGACMSGLAPEQVELVHYQAPGQTGNGPLTEVNGEIITNPAYEGLVGCAR